MLSNRADVYLKKSEQYNGRNAPTKIIRHGFVVKKFTFSPNQQYLDYLLLQP